MREEEGEGGRGRKGKQALGKGVAYLKVKVNESLLHDLLRRAGKGDRYVDLPDRCL